jgi:PAS domain S-box-containing protein
MKRGRLMRLAAFGVLVLALLGGLGLAGWRSTTQLAATAAEAQGTQRVLTLLATLWSSLTEAEAGQLVYATSGDAAALEPTQRARAEADADLARLRELLAHRPEAYSRLLALAPLLAQRFDALAAAVELRRRGGSAALTPAAGAEGRRLHDRVRAAVLELQQRTEADLAALQQRSADAAARVRQMVLLTLAAALLLACAALAWLTRELRARRRAEAARDAGAERERRLGGELERVLARSLDGVFALDLDGRITQANAGCERLWGWRADELVGKPWLDLLLADERPRAHAVATRVMGNMTGGAPAADLRLRSAHKDGRVLTLRINASAYDEGQALLCIVRDVSDVEALREQAGRHAEALRETEAALALAREGAGAAERLKSAFLSTMSQELRAPLQSIIAGTGTLAQGLAGPVSAEQARQLESQQAGARQVLKVVNDVLDIARLQSGLLQVAQQPFDLWEAIQKVAARLRPRAERKDLLLVLKLDRDLALARGDAHRVEQLLHNLIDNAIKFTASGSITVSAQAEPDGRLRVAVADTGTGIAEADLDALFKPFRQLGAPGQAQQGSGLGLALSQQLARLMGGDLEVRSVPAQGSTFTLWLHAEPAPS